MSSQQRPYRNNIPKVSRVLPDCTSISGPPVASLIPRAGLAHQRPPGGFTFSNRIFGGVGWKSAREDQEKLVHKCVFNCLNMLFGRKTVVFVITIHNRLLFFCTFVQMALLFHDKNVNTYIYIYILGCA